MRRLLVVCMLFCYLLVSGCAIAGDADKLLRILHHTYSEDSGQLSKLTVSAIIADGSGLEQEIVKQYLTNCSFSVETCSDGIYAVSISLPDLDALDNTLRGNSSFLTEYTELQVLDASKEELKNCSLAFIKNLLLSGTVDSEVITVNISYDGGDDAELDSVDTVITDGIKQMLEYRFGGVSEQQGIQAEQGSIQECSGLDDFVCNIDGKMLVSGISILEGSDALKRLIEIADDNSNIVVNSGDKVYCVEYLIYNLSKSKVLNFKNAFRLVDSDGALLETTGFHVVGMREKAKIKAGSRQKMSCCLVGPQDAMVCWYTKGMQGARVFHLT